MKIHCILLLSIMLPTWTFSACGTGTLQCSSSNVPLVCDFTQNYVLNGDSCEVKKVDGCEIASFDSSNAPCFLCEKGKVLDSNSELCVNVETEKVVQNCFRYEKSSSDCIECDTDYYLSGGTCSAVGNIKVENCAIYSSITQCQTCDSGYYLVENECVKIESVSNCRVHSNRKCTSCTSNYFLNDSYISNPPAANVETFDLFASGNFDQISINLISNVSTVCQKITVKHCSVLETAHTCSKCETNYFLTSSKLCERNPEVPISNCLKYKSQTVCSECVDTHYVKNNNSGVFQNCTKIPVIEFCETYDKANGFCTACVAGYYLNTTLNSCVQRQYNPPLNCQVTDPYADLCTTCLTGYSKVTNGTGCLANIQFCINTTISDNVEAGKHVCVECDDDHYLVNQLCANRTITGCKTYVDQRNACEVCEDTHYISEDKNTCTLLNIPFCNAYTTDDMNTCLTCDNLKKPSSDSSTCEDITNLDSCLKSNGQNDNCLECNPDKLLVSNACTGTKTETKYDSNCASSTSSTDDSACESCKTGFAKANLASGDYEPKPVITEADMATKNCYKIKSDADECVQCNEGYFVDGAGLCVEDPTPTTSPCLQLKDTASGTETLASPSTHCEKCRTNLGYTFTAASPTTCVEAEDPTFYIGCENVNSDSGICSECKSGYYPVDQTIPFCANESFTPSKFQPLIQHCAVRKDFDKCLICDKDYVINSLGTVCETVSGGNTLYFNTFDISLNQKGSSSITTIADCAQYTQVDENEFLCTQCSTNFVGVVSKTHVSATLMSMGVGNEYYNPFEKCVDKNLMYKTLAGVDHVAVDDCMLGFQDSGSGYGCLRCVSGKVGVWMEVTKLNDNSTALSGTLNVIGNCVADTTLGMALDYIGFSTLEGGLSTYKLSILSPYSNCSTTPSHVVFYMYKWNLTNGVSYNPSTDGSNENKIAFCGAVADVLANPNTAVDNCAVYAFSETVPSTFIQGTTKITAPNCVACKPGFYVAETDNSTGITSCLAIHGCNTAGVSGNNKWMSGCSHPDSGGWKAKISSGNYIVSYNDPMPNSAPYKIDNCLVLDQAQSKCVVCTPGFTATSSGCESVSSENSECTTSSMGYTALLSTGTYITTAGNKKFRYADFTHVRQLHSSASTYENNSNSFCQTCNTNTHLMVSSESTKVCAKRPFETKFVENCLKYGLTNCYKCKPGYTLDSSSADVKCEIFSDTNCENQNSSNCSKCNDGYRLIGGTCVEHHCAEFHSDNSCLLCEPNMVPHPTSNEHCSADAPANEECEVFSPKKDKFCVKCKDSSKFPYNIIYTSNFQHHTCVSGSFPANGWKNLNLASDYWFIHNIYIAPDVFSVMGTIPSASRLRRIKDSTGDGDPAENLCIPTRSMTNCSSTPDDLICLGCNVVTDASLPIYVHLNNNTCSNSNTITGCKNINPDRVHCDTCHDNYYISDDLKTCHVRNASQNCNVPTENADTCQSCVAKSFVMNSSSVCVEYTAENCKVRHDTQDKCEICVDNAWMDQSDGDKCKLSEDVQCVLMKSFENECQKCANGFYLKTEGLIQTCKEVTAPNCSTNKTHEDKCLTCKTQFWLNSSFECNANTEIDFCITYSTDSDECAECNEGYYSVSGEPECRKYPTGIAECDGYSSITDCTSCRAEFYLKDNTCHAVTTSISGCEEYDSERTCSKCKDTHFLTSNTKCDVYDATAKIGCSVFESFEKCKTCLDTYILNEETKLCEPSGITHCKTATRGSPNLCQECNSGYFPSSNRQTCDSPSVLIDNCMDYETQTKCKKCNDMYLLNLNGSECISIGDKAGANCAVGHEVDKLECDLCEFGYQKNEIGECVKITEPYCAFMSGDKCGLCLPNMKMTSEGKCENPNVVTEPESIAVYKVFAYLLTFLVMFR